MMALSLFNGELSILFWYKKDQAMEYDDLLQQNQTHLDLWSREKAIKCHFF